MEKINNFLFIGSGQFGTTLTNLLIKNYQEVVDIENKLFFNTNKDNDVKDLIELRDKDNKFDGSGREIKYVQNFIIPENKEKIKNAVVNKITDEIQNVVLLNSLGGASGSSINLHIIKDVLIPYKMEHPDRELNIILVGVIPSQMEGLPSTSNSAAMMQQYYNLTTKITVIPIENEKVYITPKKGETTYYQTNKYIADMVFKMINYKQFLGTPKENGYNTLDLAEYKKIMRPSDGFLTYSCFPDLTDEKINSLLNDFDVESAKKAIIVFKTSKYRYVGMNDVKKVSLRFPNTLKIITESQSDDKNSIEILANGVDIPNYYMENISETIQTVNNYKEVKVQTKESNKLSLKDAGSSLLSI